MSSEWDWWQDALDGKKPQMSPDSPEWGYYRTQRKDGPWEPAQIWQDADGWVATRNGEELRNIEYKDGKVIVTGKVDELWNWCGQYPITQDEFEHRTAGTWQGDDPTVAAAKTAGPPLNSEGVDEAEILRDQIEAAKEGAKAYAKVTSAEQAAKGQSLRSRLLELSGEADKTRVKLKAPHKAAADAVDHKWQPLVKDAKASADDIRTSISAFETEELKKRQAEERRIEQARLAAEKEAREKAEAAGRPDLVETFVEAAVPSLPAPATTIKGTYGRAATKTVEIFVAEITDQDALYAYMRDHVDLKQCLFDLAKRAHKAGHTVPGIRLDERMSVR